MCEPECPVGAIVADYTLDEVQQKKWHDINAKYSLIWPVITEIIPSMEGAEEMAGIPNKFETYFSEEPGKGTS